MNAPAKPRAQGPSYWFDEAGQAPLHARVVAALYSGVTGLRRGLYARGLLRKKHPGVPVIVVGNLIAGGAGKTPLTVALVERLRNEGWTPGVASRGYGRDGDGPRWVEADTSVRQAGDEPLLVARQTGARVRVGRDRAAAARALVGEGCDIVVCDDGLQHYRLARDVEIEVIDGRRRYGNGLMLPAGPLREPVWRGGRCDFRVVNSGGNAMPETGFGEWPMRLACDRALPLTGGRPRALASFAGHRVHAVAGIGDPERFFAMLRALDIAVVPHAFPDHHRYRASDFEFGSRLPVLMTEKDAVKCAQWVDPSHYAVPVRAELPEAFWISLLDRLGGKSAKGAEDVTGTGGKGSSRDG
ncbi:tetraacyldisaccharide 4'-kinase [Lysobacter sp. A3-1-A15]|uniref:tetraacyldisaccharide 4'-kinase n=1 Tax=Novilysobacter viscosus TaxID=3098602 RepID=UPI002ED9248D